MKLLHVSALQCQLQAVHLNEGTHVQHANTGTDHPHFSVTTVRAISTWISVLDMYSFVQVDNLRMALQCCNMKCML